MTSTAQPPRAPAPKAWSESLLTGLRHVAEMAATPLVPEDFLDMVAPLRHGADLRGRIVDIHPETPDAATILIKPGKDWRGHLPGQYLRIGVDVDGVRQWRAYSLTHGPRTDGRISITVKAVPDGAVSPHLVHRAKPGTMVFLDQAAGDFVLPPEGGRFLFVTAGSGITPVIGMLRNLFPATDSGVLRLPRSANFDVVVVHVAPSKPDSIFIEDLTALHEAGAITLIPRYDDVHGLLDVNDLQSLVPDLVERATYACGPAGLLDALDAHHQARGLPLFVEKFRTSRVTPGEGGTLTVGGQEMVTAGDTTILDAAEAAGVLMKSGCRMGICFGCVVPLEEGAVRDLRSGEITTADPEESGSVPIQTCVTAVAGSARLGPSERKS